MESVVTLGFEAAEKTKQCHTEASCLCLLRFNEKEKHSIQGLLHKMGGAVTLSEAASFLSAILNERAELNSTTD